MKKKKQIFDKDFKMPNLFREDLENIELIIKNYLKPSEYKLESESFEYSEVAEIKINPKQINNLRIQTNNPDLFIDLTKKKASIHADDDGVNTVGSIKKMMDIIEKRERKFLWYSSNVGMLLILPLMTLSILSLVSLQLVDKLYAIIILVSSIILLVGGLYATEYQFSIINFMYKEDKPSFFRRNKDQIGVNVIIAIISFLLGLLLKIK